MTYMGLHQQSRGSKCGYESKAPVEMDLKMYEPSTRMYKSGINEVAASYMQTPSPGKYKAITHF